ncbi:hypothetical protein M2271_007862 [Streptomyces sp. LBL]|uniref:hypothetical protein n=1 Tax=Streptomyces sp. LBL TaxID=2940562 RepID=UPI002474B0BB|nr:hypothetical protein [Streptomyces sp. LBL]MDH6630012.1 hypothetical protein [Streptomyces sp. LBL]
MGANIAAMLAAVITTFIPVGWRAFRQLAQLRRLNSVQVDITGHKVTFEVKGRDAHLVDLDLADAGEAARFDRFLNEYDSRSAGRDA